MTVEEIVAALKAIVDGAEGRDITDEEAAQVAELEQKLETARRSQELRKRVNAYATPVQTMTIATQIPDETARGFDTLLRTAKSDDWVQAAQSEGIGSEGGYLVPTTFRDKIVEKKLAHGGFAAEAEQFNTSNGNPVTWVTLDDTANQGAITPENATFAGGADLVFGQATLGAYKYTTGGAGNLPLKISYELLQDAAFDIEAKLAGWFATRIARKQAVHFLTGDGAGEPLGLLTPKTAYDAATAATPTYAELLATIHALDPEYRANAKWLMNDATLAVIRGILDGDNRPLLWGASDNMSMSPGGLMLLGHPVIIDQAMPSTAASGATKFLAFGDFKQAYVIRTVKQFELTVARELYMNNGQVGYLGWERADGTVQDANAYVVLSSPA